VKLLKIKSAIYRRIKPHHLFSFIHSIPRNGRVFDIGCGNNSPFIVKTLRPDVYYAGLDVGLYNQTHAPSRFANEFIVTEPSLFHLKIAERSEAFDCVISNHNLEHCDDYELVTLAMVKSLKKGGRAYIAFPCEESIHFPERKHPLNFAFDSTHRNLIGYSPFISLLKENGMKILFSGKRYRPIIPFIIGLLYEPVARLSGTPSPAGGTWALYGFETIVIAQKE